MKQEKFREGLYAYDPDPPVKISDVEKAYAEARKVFEPSYRHPQWGDVAKEKARVLIDIITVSARANEVDVSITGVVRHCVSRWGNFRQFVLEQDRRGIVSQEPSIGAILRHYGLAVQFSWDVAVSRTESVTRTNGSTESRHKSDLCG